MDILRDISGIEYVSVPSTPRSQRTVVGRIGGALLEYRQSEVLIAVRMLPPGTKLPVPLTRLVNQFHLKPIPKEAR